MQGDFQLGDRVTVQDASGNYQFMRYAADEDQVENPEALCFIVDVDTGDRFTIERTRLSRRDGIVPGDLLAWIALTLREAQQNRILPNDFHLGALPAIGFEADGRLIIQTNRTFQAYQITAEPLAPDDRPVRDWSNEPPPPLS